MKNSPVTDMTWPSPMGTVSNARYRCRALYAVRPRFPKLRRGLVGRLTTSL